MIRRALLTLLVGLSLAGCSASGSAHGPAVLPSATPTTAVSAGPALATAPAQPADPVSVEIPRLAVRSSLIGLGLLPDGTLQTPDVKHPEQAGWYRLGVRPGAPGPAVIIGHVDGDGRPGVFFRLKELRPGDEIKVTLDYGKVLTFRVVSTEVDSKSAFPTKKVYGDVDHPALRLITCGGEFDAAHRNYLSNVVVFADLVS